MSLPLLCKALRLGLGVGLLALAGCSVTQPRAQRFVTSFVPPKPRLVQAEVVLPDPPDLSEGLLARADPGLMLAAMASPPPPPEVDRRIQRAEVRFSEGRRLAEAGEWETARVEFDRALDALLGAPTGIPERHRLEDRYRQMIEAIHRLEAAELGRDDQEPVFEKSPLDDILEKTFPMDPALTPRIREQIAATASQLPLEVNDAVMSYIHYFSTRGRRTLENGLVRLGRYRPMIQRILDEEGVPQELVYLAQAESGFQPRAVSRKKATGMWQFIQSRGQEYGLMQREGTDDRLDPEKATRAAARHLRDLYHEFGDWYLALAAYNSGPHNVSRAVERTGYANVWELRNRKVLPKETCNYLPIILALTIMAKNPREYGLEKLQPDPPIEYDTIEVPTATHLGLIADILDLPVSEIRTLNPAVLKPVAPAGYVVRTPKGTAKAVVAGLDMVPSERRAGWRLHRVRADQTLEEIARRYRVPERTIGAANGGRGSVSLEEGDLLVIPAAYVEPVPPRASPKAAPKKKATTTRASARPAARVYASSSLRASKQGSYRR